MSHIRKSRYIDQSDDLGLDGDLGTSNPLWVGSGPDIASRFSGSLSAGRFGN